ncbi:MAG: hypothetical protein AAGI52_01600 [Bacteroidota bacterium]
MIRRTHAAARFIWAVAFLFVAFTGLAACGAEADPEDRDRLAVRHESVAALRAEGAARFLTTDDALAELETVVAALDSAGQASAGPRLEALRSTRASLQTRLDSLEAEQFGSVEAFSGLAAEVRESLDALDAAIARDRVRVVPDAVALRTYASARLGALMERAASLRADSTLASIQEAAALDSARVRLERQSELLRNRKVRFDSLREVLASGFADLEALSRDTLAMRFRPDSLR